MNGKQEENRFTISTPKNFATYHLKSYTPMITASPTITNFQCWSKTETNWLTSSQITKSKQPCNTQTTSLISLALTKNFQTPIGSVPTSLCCLIMHGSQM